MAIKTRIFRIVQDANDTLSSLTINISDDGVVLTPPIVISIFPNITTTGLPVGVLSVNVGANNNGTVVGILEFDDDIINGNVFLSYGATYTSGTYSGSTPTKIIPCVPPVLPPPPIARVTNTYIGTTNQGDFTGTFHITENDDITPLQVGDEVTLTFRSGTNNYFLGEATFNYGADISSATPTLDNGFVANLRPYFASGSTLVNGGSYVFLKKPFAQNWHNNNAGAMAGINLGEEIIIEIRVKDTSVGQTSVNTDNTTTLIKLHETVGYLISISRTAALIGTTPATNPNSTQDYVTLLALGNNSYSYADLVANVANTADYEHYYNNTAGVTANTPSSSVIGTLNRAGGVSTQSTSWAISPFWITLAGTTNNTGGFYKRHKLLNVRVFKYPKLNFQNLNTSLDVVGFVKNTQLRDTSLIPLTNYAGAISGSLLHTVQLFSRNSASVPPSLFTSVDVWVSSFNNQNPLFGTQLANNVPYAIPLQFTFTTAGDGEYFIYSETKDSLGNVISLNRSSLIQISY